jgi:flagellar biosynthesis/type III secretory pathway protein FliH
MGSFIEGAAAEIRQLASPEATRTLEEVLRELYEDAYRAGHSDGYQEGNDDGFNEGVNQ